jgi:hypothetical protein
VGCVIEAGLGPIDSGCVSGCNLTGDRSYHVSVRVVKVDECEAAAIVIYIVRRRRCNIETFHKPFSHCTCGPAHSAPQCSQRLNSGRRSRYNLVAHLPHCLRCLTHCQKHQIVSMWCRRLRQQGWVLCMRQPCSSPARGTGCRSVACRLLCCWPAAKSMPQLSPGATRCHCGQP